MGLHASFELRTRHGIPKSGPLDESLSRKLLHAYYACVSYVDAQIGRVLKILEENRVRDNTIIVVWGDHGWHLGEYGIWGKATNYEIATRVPLIISTPSMPQKGSPSNSVVELIDIYPTLCDLANIPQPDHLAGKSLVPVLHNPNAIVKGMAMSQFPTPALREWAADPLSPEMRETFFGPLISQVEQKSENNKEASGTENFLQSILWATRYGTLATVTSNGETHAIQMQTPSIKSSTIIKKTHMKQSISHTLNQKKLRGYQANFNIS